MSQFIHFVFHEKNNRRLIILAVIATVAQFIIFKLLYPYPDFFSDSYSYIFAASAKLEVNIWPIGYSKFLGLFHQLTHSDTALVAFQYFFLELAALYFFFSKKYFYNPGKITGYILFIFLFFNPLFLYIGNYINSDGLFAALSLLWLTELIWIINCTRPYQLLTQSVLLFLSFTVRHNAMYYPFIAMIVFVLSKQKLSMKLVGISLGLVIVCLFVVHERNSSYELYGAKQFSPMSGWQLANNALYMRGNIEVDTSRLANAEVRELDKISTKFFDHVPADFNEFLAFYVANFFIRQPQAPLKTYFDKHFNPKDEKEMVIAWGKVSVVFDEYGSWLIRHYPIEYLRYFLLVNAKNYFFPPLEKLEVYNLGENQVSVIGQDWFDYKTPYVTSISKDAQSYVLFIFPSIFLFINLLFLGSIVWASFRKGIRIRDFISDPLIILAASLYLANSLFSIGSSMIVLRYQFFPIIACLAFTLLILEWMDKKIKETAALGAQISAGKTNMEQLRVQPITPNH